MGLTMGKEVCVVVKKPSPLGRVPPKGAGEVRYKVPIICCLAANPYCGNTSSVFFIALGGDEKSTFPKGEGFDRRNLCLTN